LLKVTNSADLLFKQISQTTIICK